MQFRWDLVIVDENSFVWVLVRPPMIPLVAVHFLPFAILGFRDSGTDVERFKTLRSVCKRAVRYAGQRPTLFSTKNETRHLKMLEAELLGPHVPKVRLMTVPDTLRFIRYLMSARRLKNDKTLPSVADRVSLALTWYVNSLHLHELAGYNPLGLIRVRNQFGPYSIVRLKQQQQQHDRSERSVAWSATWSAVWSPTPSKFVFTPPLELPLIEHLTELSSNETELW